MPQHNDVPAEVRQSPFDLANELGTTPQGRDALQNLEQQNAAKQDATFWQNLRKFAEKIYSASGRIFYQDNGESARILQALQGKLGKTKEEREKNKKDAESKVSQALSELHRLQQAPGDGSWLNVTDNLFRVLAAYMEYRKQQGFPDTIGGRTHSVGACLFGSIRSSLPVAFVEGVWDVCNKVVKEFKPAPESNVEAIEPLEETEQRQGVPSL